MKNTIKEIINSYTNKIKWYEENEPGSIVAEGWKLGLAQAIHDLQNLIN